MLEVRDLHAYYGKSHILHGVNLDVGQGDALLLTLPGGERWLVDGGGDPGGHIDVGQRLLLPALRRRGVALVVSDAADWPTVGDLTAGFVYVRLHGPAERYASAYGPRLLARWAERIRIWAAGGVPDDVPRIDPGDPPRPPRRGRPVWVFFNNDAGAHAPADAVALRDLLGLG